MDKDVSGVRISPAAIDFYDTVTNTVEQLNITVKNISKGSKSIRFYGPKTKVNCELIICQLMCIFLFCSCNEVGYELCNNLRLDKPFKSNAHRL